MTCTKTGAHIYLEPYNLYAHCDAFEIDENIAYFRIVEVSYTPLGSSLHYKVIEIENWFKDKPVQTLISNKWINHGYDGIHLDG